MPLFKRKSTQFFKWKDLDSNSLLDVALGKSAGLVAIFKHSTRCSISSMVKSRFEGNLSLEDGQADVYLLDLISFREISNRIAEELNVQHESPQLIILKNGEVVHHSSHTAIDAKTLNEFAQ